MAIQRSYNLLLLFLSLFLFSCRENDSDNNPASTYDTGILFINEGPFQNGSGSIFHYNRTTGEMTDDIFALANTGAKVGNVLQSASNWQGKTYLMVNNSNRIYVVDPKSFAFLDSIKGISQPRYFMGISAQKAVVSSWDKGVSFINLPANQVANSVATGNGADKMLLDANTLYVLNSGGFVKDSTITLVDVLSEKVIKKIKAAPSPNSIVKAGNSTWVLCGGYWDLPGEGTLIEYKFEQIVNTYKVPKFASNLIVSSDGTELFFTAENAIFRKSIPTPSEQPQPFLKRKFVFPYALNQDPISGKLLMSDAGDFSSKSKTFFIDPNTGTITDSVLTGIATNGFLFGN